jgi:hypothetical protein
VVKDSGISLALRGCAIRTRRTERLTLDAFSFNDCYLPAILSRSTSASGADRRPGCADLLSWREFFIEKLLNCLEQLHPVLFH